jgi:hypothetical protein
LPHKQETAGSNPAPATNVRVSARMGESVSPVIVARQTGSGMCPAARQSQGSCPGPTVGVGSKGPNACVVKRLSHHPSKLRSRVRFPPHAQTMNRPKRLRVVFEVRWRGSSIAPSVTLFISKRDPGRQRVSPRSMDVPPGQVRYGEGGCSALNAPTEQKRHRVEPGREHRASTGATWSVRLAD